MIEKEILQKIEQDFRNFLNQFYLLKDIKPDFFNHYLRSAKIAHAIGKIDPIFSDPLKNKYLYDATLYCDIGLDINIKMGKKLHSDNKRELLKDHINRTINLLKGGDYFFKNASRLIAWHHWQPDGFGYFPKNLPSLEAYKRGGCIISIATAFDSIYTRLFKEKKSNTETLASTLSILKKNIDIQFTQEIYSLFMQVLKTGFELTYDQQRILHKTNQQILQTIDFFIDTGIFDFDKFSNAPETKEQNRKVKRIKKYDPLEEFNETYDKIANGESYNINNVTEGLETLVKIIVNHQDQFSILYPKLINFISLFKYPDGDLKSFIKENFIKFHERYYDPFYGYEIKDWLNSLFQLWKLYVTDELPHQSVEYIEINFIVFLTMIKEFQKKFRLGSVRIPLELRDLTKERIILTTEDIRDCYDPAQIDRYSDKINFCRDFLKLWMI